MLNFILDASRGIFRIFKSFLDFLYPNISLDFLEAYGIFRGVKTLSSMYFFLKKLNKKTTLKNLNRFKSGQ